MTSLLYWTTHDQVLIWAASLFCQVTVVTALALAIAVWMRRNSPARYGVLCAALLLVLACPAISLVMQASGHTVFSVSLISTEPRSARPPADSEPAPESRATAGQAVISATQSPSHTLIGAAEREPRVADRMIDGNRQDGASEDARRRATGGANDRSEASGVGPAHEGFSNVQRAAMPSSWFASALRLVVPPILAVWLAGSLLLLARLGIGCCRLVAMLRTATPNRDASLAEAILEVGRLLRLERAPELVLSDRVSGPISTGFFRPRVVLPNDLVDRAPPAQLRDVLLHEVAHVARRDQAMVLLQNLAAAMFWPHPLVRALNRRLAQAREEVCDNYVLAASDAPSYCRTLLALAHRDSSVRCLPGAVGLFTSRWKLERRISDLLDKGRNRSTRLNRSGRAGVAASTLVLSTAAFFGTISLAVGQTKDNEPGTNAQTPAASANSPPDVGREAPPDDDPETRALRGSVGDSLRSLVAAALGRAETSIVRGSVETPDGRPAAGALVAAVGWKLTGDSPGGHTMTEGVTDSEGQYELVLQGVSSKTYTYANVIARTEESAIAWHRLDLNATESQIDLALQPQQPIQVHLVGLEGGPAASVAVELASIIKTQENNGFPQEGVGFHHLDPRPPAAVPILTSDEQGLLTIPHVPAGHGVLLKVRGDERFAPQDLALNTGMPEERGERDATYRALVKNMPPGEVVTIPLAPAQVFEGVVLLGDSDEPATNARITMWASQQEIGGSMISVEGRTDAEGRFRLNPYPGVRFGIKAHPPEGTPYLVHEIDDLRWTSGDASKNLEIRLDRAMLAEGTVVDGKTGEPLRGASVQYHPDRLNPNVTSDIVTGWQGIQRTDDAGKFAITVLPGPGMLLFHAEEGNYLLQTIGSRELTKGQTGGVRMYAHAFQRIHPNADEPLEPVRIELEPGTSISGTLVDTEGNPVEHAVMVSRLMTRPTSPRWRGFPEDVMGGRFRLDGLREGEEYPVFFLDPKNRLGASAVVSTNEPSPKIVLEPCGSATARFVNPEGKSVRQGLALPLYMVVTPGKPRFDIEANRRGEVQADETFLSSIDRVNYRPMLTTDQNGQITYPALIPGAQYRFIQLEDGAFSGVKEFVAVSGENYDMGEIEVEISE